MWVWKDLSQVKVGFLNFQVPINWLHFFYSLSIMKIIEKLNKIKDLGCDLYSWGSYQMGCGCDPKVFMENSHILI
jgi:hypothetical protein